MESSPHNSANILNIEHPDTASDLAQEIPVAISVNDISHAVMMLTPIDLEYFAIGFAFSEGIIDHYSDLRDLDIYQHNVALQQGEGFQLPAYNIAIKISPRQSIRYKKQHSFRQGLTGCGICGTAALDVAIPDLNSLPHSALPPKKQLLHLPNTLFSLQKLKGVHAALLLSPEGEVVTCHEDIGRHNALDKTIGFALKNNIQLNGFSILMSSRCSVELIQKAVKAKLSTLIHISSPSHLATQMAHHYNLNLIQITRKGELKTFSQPPIL
ncbi:formate dehydrogenase accessory sulfurtransferase FdhD [Neptuniibacter marinus]|uniref:formate dehydrogenase accessory sulfurtransferase FdhD n=1 Tax=Neptuniibacter marinus TaxID=1806670 RepID=UPI000833A599|nr:formate dehydrogenase accessory sulfurtransferase FdhD [Neptuniibacter marinus]